MSATETPTELQLLELQLSRRDQGPAAYLGPHLDAVIRNRGESPVGIRRVDLTGSRSQESVVEVTGVPATVGPDRTLRFAINLTWREARSLRRDGGVVLAVKGDGDESVRSDPLEIKDLETWRVRDEVQALVGMLVVAPLWFVFWEWLTHRPRALQIIGWPIGAAAAGALCWQYYARLWRGELTWGTGLTVGVGKRVRPLTDVLLTSVIVWVTLTAPLAFATYLVEGRHLSAGGAGALLTGHHDRYSQAVGLYAWGAVDVLPFVQATHTLHWADPVQNYSRATGALLVLYKALVLAPLIAAAVAAWRSRARREPRPLDRSVAAAHAPPEK